MRNQQSTRLSRPVGSNEPFTFKPRRGIAVKEVYLGNHKPTDHFASAAHVFVPAGDLYDNRKR